MEEKAVMEQKELQEVPAEIEQEASVSVTRTDSSIEALALRGPAALEEYLSARQKALETLHAVAIKTSHPYDWTLYKDRDGRVVGVPRDSACVNIRKWMGIEISGYKPINKETGIPEPKVSVDDTSGHRVQVVEMWADGHCKLTGESVAGVYYALRSDDEFIGRRLDMKDRSSPPRLQDMKAACRTGLDAKITRILSGLRKVPEETLERHAIDLDKAHKGMGYGSGGDRETAKVSEEGVADEAKKLGEEILRRVGGDKQDAKKLCKEITAGKNFAGFDSVARLSKKWQVENAWTALKAHEVFGDKPAGRDEPELFGGK